MDRLKKLVRDPRDRNVRDLELLLAQQVQQQVQRTVERIELDDETWPRAERGGGGALGRASCRKMFQPSTDPERQDEPLQQALRRTPGSAGYTSRRKRNRSANSGR